MLPALMTSPVNLLLPCLEPPFVLGWASVYVHTFPQSCPSGAMCGGADVGLHPQFCFPKSTTVATCAGCSALGGSVTVEWDGFKLLIE